MIFRQLFDPQSSTYSYLLGDERGGDAVLMHPKRIDVAVPANLRCGCVADAPAQAAEPAWAPLTFTFAGIWEIHAQALEEVSSAVQIVDVREASEYNGPLGHIRGAVLIPP